MAEQLKDAEAALDANVTAQDIANEILQDFENGKLEGQPDVLPENVEVVQDSATEDETPQQETVSKEESETTEEETVTEEETETQVEEQEETDGEPKFVTAEEIRNLPTDEWWAQMSQWRKEGRLTDEQLRGLSAMESGYHRTTKKKDDEYKIKLEKQNQELMNKLLEQQNQQKLIAENQQRQLDEQKQREWLDSLDPDERAMQEERLKSQQVISDLESKVNQLTQMVTSQQTASYSRSIKQEIRDAVSEIKNLDPDLAKVIEEDSLPQLYIAWDEDKRIGKTAENFTSPKEVVGKIHEKYKRLLAPEKIKKIVETGDEYKDLVKNIQKKGKEELIQRKSKGGKTVPQSPKGGELPQPKTQVPEAIIDPLDYVNSVMEEIEREHPDEMKE